MVLPKRNSSLARRGTAAPGAAKATGAKGGAGRAKANAAARKKDVRDRATAPARPPPAPRPRAPSPSPPPRANPLAAEAIAHMRELEVELDRLLDQDARREELPAYEEDGDDDASNAPTPRDAEQEAAPVGPASAEPSMAGKGLSTDADVQRSGRLAVRDRSHEVDDFGYDPAYDEKVRPALDFLYRTYCRVDASGVDNVPEHGRCLLVANRSSTLPLDAVIIKTAIRREHRAARLVRWLTEDFTHRVPLLGNVMTRLGAVRACDESAERLLGDDALVAVFPEGTKGVGGLFANPYRLRPFGHRGFIQLGLRTRTPLVPVAVVIRPAGPLPAPTKGRLAFGAPIDLGAYGPEAAADDRLVGELAERVRANIQTLLDRQLHARRGAFFG